MEAAGDPYQMVTGASARLEHARLGEQFPDDVEVFAAATVADPDHRRGVWMEAASNRYVLDHGRRRCRLDRQEIEGGLVAGTAWLARRHI